MGEQLRSEYLADMGVVAQKRESSVVGVYVGKSAANFDNIEHPSEGWKPSPQLAVMEWIAELGSREELSDKDQQLVKYLEASIAEATQLDDEEAKTYLASALEQAEKFDEQEEIAVADEEVVRNVGEVALSQAA